MKRLQIFIWLFLVSLVVIFSVFGLKPFINTVDPKDTLIDESGFYPTDSYRLSDATYLVSVRTVMPDVKAKMVRWWFADFLETSEHYSWWHPKDHIWMDWENKKPDKIIGASHLVHEYIGEDLNKLRIQFVNSSEFFGYDVNDEDTFAICARIGNLETDLNIAKMCHIVRNTSTGAEMRSRFWLGHVAKREGNRTVYSMAGFIGNMAITRLFLLNKKRAEDLKHHAMEEMKYLAELLPSLYTSKERINQE